MKPQIAIGKARDGEGDTERFISFARRILQVPHSEIKEKLDAEREAKRTSKIVSRDSAVSSKKR